MLGLFVEYKLKGKQRLSAELHTVSGGDLAGSAIVSLVFVLVEQERGEEKSSNYIQSSRGIVVAWGQNVREAIDVEYLVTVLHGCALSMSIGQTFRQYHNPGRGGKENA